MWDMLLLMVWAIISECIHLVMGVENVPLSNNSCILEDLGWPFKAFEPLDLYCHYLHPDNKIK